MKQCLALIENFLPFYYNKYNINKYATSLILYIQILFPPHAHKTLK